MGWASSGFDALDEIQDGGGGGGESSGSRVLNYWTPWAGEGNTPTTKLIVLLDDEPFGFWAHNMWVYTKKSGDNEICLRKNGIADKCPLCEKAEQNKTGWASFSGYLTVIDCGEVRFGAGEDDKERQIIDALEGWDNGKTGDSHRVYQFGKKLLKLNRGGKDKPGLMVELRRLKERKGGSLVGTVWAVTRKAQKEETCGTGWEYRGRIDVSSTESLKAALVDLPGSPLHGTDDSMLKFVDNEPINYAEHFEPKSYAQLASLVGMKVAPAPAPASNVSGDDGDMDEDIPF